MGEISLFFFVEYVVGVFYVTGNVRRGVSLMLLRVVGNVFCQFVIVILPDDG
jgi:hypothetical protein